MSSASGTGSDHPIARILTGLTIDDVAARYPAGDLVALRFSQIVRRNLRTYRQDDMYIVPSASQTLYRDLTGDGAPLAFRPPAEDRAPWHPSGPQECQNPQGLLQNPQRMLRSPDWPIVDCPGCGKPTVPGTYDPVTRVLTPAPPLCHACRADLV